MPQLKVLEVIDGDTFRGPRKKFIRLAGVDAPELGTKGAAAARNKLADMISSKTITYTTKAKSYGRDVSQVKIAGKDVCAAMKRYLKK